MYMYNEIYAHMCVQIVQRFMQVCTYIHYITSTFTFTCTFTFTFTFTLHYITLHYITFTLHYININITLHYITLH